MLVSGRVTIPTVAPQNNQPLEASVLPGDAGEVFTALGVACMTHLGGIRKEVESEVAR